MALAALREVLEDVGHDRRVGELVMYEEEQGEDLGVQPSEERIAFLEPG